MKNYLFIFLSVCILISCATKGQVYVNSDEKTLNILKWIKPPNLKSGDTIAILSPASYLKDSIYEIKTSLDSLKSWGLNYKLYDHIFDVERRFAGKDELRASDFQKAIDNNNIKAIWCARGGYGSVRIIDRINFNNLKTNPKWIIGYSDVTVIHNKLHNIGIQSVHAVMPVSFKDTLAENKEAIKSFKNVLFGIKNDYKIKSSAYNKLGESQGVLVGGNLTLLHTMLGSNTSINVDGKILFIEDIGEYTYNIDRMLYSLKRADYFDNCSGVVVGAFSKIKENNPPFTKNIEELILAVLSEYQFPIVFNFPVGHINDNRALIIGEKVNLIVNKDVTTLRFY